MIPAHSAPTVINPHAGPRLVDTYHFTMKASPALHVATENGSVSIKGGDGNEIVVTVTRRGGSAADMKAIAVKAAQSGNAVDVSSQMPTGCSACTASYEITVPRSTTIDASSDFGSIGVENVAGDVDAMTKHGPILCGGLSGNVKLTSENGMLNAGFSDLSHVSTVTLGTANGAIRIVLPPHAKVAHLKAGTANGAITSPGLALNVARKGTGAAVDQTLASSGPTIVLGTASGPIAIVTAP